MQRIEPAIQERLGSLARRSSYAGTHCVYASRRVRLVLPLLLLLVRPPVADGIPRGPSSVEALSTKALRHHEVLRIDRDFGMEHWEIALDGWLPSDRAAHIEDVRLWWVNTDDADHRKPFSARLQRYLEFGYRRDGAGVLAVRMAGDGKEYLFNVELDASGAPAVFSTVVLADGTIVERCRCERGRLIARRILGVPVGIEKLSVRCIDGASQPQEGIVPYRELTSSRPYEPE